MANIFKYPLKATDWQFVSMPEGAEILCVQTQRETPCLWALVDPAMAPTMRKIHVYGTGHDIPDGLNLAYIGTFQLANETLVFHAFEAVEADDTEADQGREDAMTPNDIDTEYEQFMADAPTSNIVDEEYEQFKADE